MIEGGVVGKGDLPTPTYSDPLPGIDMAKLVADSNHRPRPLIAIPDWGGREPDKRIELALEALFSQRLVEVLGFHNNFHTERRIRSVGMHSNAPLGSVEVVKVSQFNSVGAVFREAYGRAIRQFAHDLVEHQQRVGGFNLLVIEPDATGKIAVSSWYATKLKLYAYSDKTMPITGRCPSMRISAETEPTEEVHCTLEFDKEGVSVNKFVTQQANEWLKKMHEAGRNPYDANRKLD